MSEHDAPICFVSAPVAAPVKPLLDLLRRKGWRAQVLSDVAPLGAGITDAVRAAIAGADRVVVVLPQSEGATNAAFEAGMALALGKPLMVIADPRADVPSDLSGVLVVHTTLDDLAAVGFALDQVAGRDPAQHRRQVGTGHAIGAHALALAQRATKATSEQEVVGILIEAIEASGAVAVQSAGMDRGFDVGVWSDDLDAIAGNPLVIEVKKHLSDDAVRQALTALHMSPSARLGLIVTWGTDVVHAGRPVRGLAPPVLAIRLDALLARLAAESFAEIIRDLRNRAVHGLPPQ